jgi:hypothetical protein
MTRTLVVVPAGLLLTLGLSGCNTDQAGSAALVGGDRVTVAELQSTTEDLLAAGGGSQLSQADAQRITLGRYIVSDILAGGAADSGITVSETEIDARRTELEQAVGGSDQLEKELVARNVAPSYMDEFLRDIVLSEKIGAQLVPGDAVQVQSERDTAVNDLLVKTGKDVGVTVNPRYGVWDAETGQINGLVSGGLSKTAEELSSATPSPAPSPSPTGS